jgi:hypothetical protein
MYGIVNDPNVSINISVGETVEWCKSVMAANGFNKIIVSSEWARRLELEGFDMDLVEISEPFNPSAKAKSPQTAERSNGPRNRWGSLK